MAKDRSFAKDFVEAAFGDVWVVASALVLLALWGILVAVVVTLFPEATGWLLAALAAALVIHGGVIALRTAHRRALRPRQDD